MNNYSNFAAIILPFLKLLSDVVPPLALYLVLVHTFFVRKKAQILVNFFFIVFKVGLDIITWLKV